MGSSLWNGPSIPIANATTILAQGPLFVKVRLSYVFQNGKDDGTCNAHSTRFVHWTFELRAGALEALVNDSACLPYASSWTVQLNDQVGASHAALQTSFNCDVTSTTAQPTATNVSQLHQVPIQPSRRWGSTMGEFGYRWNQGCDTVSIGVAVGKEASFGVAATKGGQWTWATGRGFGFYSLAQGHDFATFRTDNHGMYNLQLPLGVGFVGNYSGGGIVTRAYYLLGRASSDVTVLPSEMRLKTQVPLDKLLNEYILDNASCSFPNFLDDDATNPTHTLRQTARAIVSNLAKGQLPALDLCTISSMADPDWYGLYRGGMGPENNNFATDFMRVPMLKSLATYGTKYQSVFQTLVVEMARMDLYYSVSDTSGAGAESPGYTEHAMESWMTDAPYYAKYFGFDTRKESRYQAAVKFLYRTSQPFAYHFLQANASRPDKLSGRYLLPLGDTHPGISLADRVLPLSGVKPDEPFSSWKSEELDGFGAVMRDKPGSMDETFLSFKASPSRGHNHGDALSFHYCSHNTRHAVDLMFGYNPRPLQVFCPCFWVATCLTSGV